MQWSDCNDTQRTFCSSCCCCCRFFVVVGFFFPENPFSSLVPRVLACKQISSLDNSIVLEDRNLRLAHGLIARSITGVVVAKLDASQNDYPRDIFPFRVVPTFYFVKVRGHSCSRCLCWNCCCCCICLIVMLVVM
jgi:hypothetical protein